MPANTSSATTGRSPDVSSAPAALHRTKCGLRAGDARPAVVNHGVQRRKVEREYPQRADEDGRDEGEGDAPARNAPSRPSPAQGQSTRLPHAVGGERKHPRKFKNDVGLRGPRRRKAQAAKNAATAIRFSRPTGFSEHSSSRKSATQPGTRANEARLGYRGP